MITQKIKLYVLLLLTITVMSCSDVKEMDISKKELKILSPPDSLKTETLTQTFWWLEVEHAEKYEFQMVSTDFDNIKQLIVDTSITTNKFTYTLKPGVYQWRVRATSDGTYTPYSVHTLTIDTTNSLNNQIVVLTAPANNMATNSTSVLLDWEPLDNATDYWVKVFKNGTEVHSATQKEDTLRIAVTHGYYSWQVKALNSTNDTETQFSNSTFVIDTEGPAIPTIKTPANLDTILLANIPVTLSWSMKDAVSSTLTITKNDTNTLVSTFPQTLTDSTYSFGASSGAAVGNFYWRVKNTDAVGNVGKNSVWYKFTIQ